MLFYNWYKWVAIVLLLLLFICLFFKCCSFDSQKTTKSNSTNSEQVIKNNDDHAKPHQNDKYVSHPLPTQPNRIIYVDPDKIEPIKNDPLGRSAVNDLINIYLKEDVIIDDFAKEFQEKFNDVSIIPTYYAEEYKRIQFQIDKDKKSYIMEVARKDTSKVKFVTNEWIYSSVDFQKGNDPDFKTADNYWFYEFLGIIDAWEYTKGKPDIKIAVLDDGFDLNHIELKNKFVQPWNVFEYSDNIYGVPKTLFHGTHVAGTIIAESNNNFGISGVAPGCQFIPVQISNETGIITITSLLDGIFYALNNNADIINLSIAYSLGSVAPSLNINEQEFFKNHFFKDEELLWDEVFEIVKNSNTIIVQAAGNDSVLAAIDPMKRSPNSIIVGSLNQNGIVSEFSNHGESVTVFVPGEKIYSSLPQNQMGYLDGTSMAAPLVSGCIALLRSEHPHLTAQEIINAVREAVNQNNNKFNINNILKELL
ncbi:MAG: S8 family serine peptidase [Flavobacteriaceae bacterium]